MEGAVLNKSFLERIMRTSLATNHERLNGQNMNR